MKKINVNLRSSRNISIISMIIFLMVAISMIYSTYYMNLCIREEEKSQTRRAEYKQLGEDLADASDYLTAEVRLFAVSGDIEHLYNYWYEIYDNRQREEAIQTFEGNYTPENEQKLLEKAKKYSDMLVETETYSMKLVLTSMKKTASDYTYDQKLLGYIRHVMAYECPEDMSNISTQEMRQKAIDILYDENYENYKTLIMTPIDEFKNTMNQRLDEEVEQRKEGTRLATMIQIVLAAVSVAGIGFLIFIMNYLYIKPLKGFTREIQDVGRPSNKESESKQEDTQALEVKIIPCGAMELIHFAEAFNHMIDLFFTELRNRKNAEESMRRARNEAELANQAKNIFLAQMSHELRTPLNAVNGYAYLLEQTDLTEKQRSYVDSIQYSSNGLLELINQILDFSKIEAGRMELERQDFNLLELILEIKSIFIHQAKKKGLELTTRIDEQIPPVVIGDALRLRQVLMNLVGNAVKFTEKGMILIELQLLKRDERECSIHFQVQDTGIGIEAEARQKIFQPFMQSDASVTRKYGGTGLGIPICNQIISLASGGQSELQLESVLGKGSTFFFNLDFEISNAQLLTKRAQSEAPHRYVNKKVLMTEDDEVNIKMQSEMLALCGLEVVTASSGMEALQILEMQKDIDLILMDIRMPVMDGFETTCRIRAIRGYEKVPILALTADAVKEVQKRTSEVGMNACLLKPIEQKQLFRLLDHFLGAANRERAWDLEATVTFLEDISSAEGLVPEPKALFDEQQCLRKLGGNQEALYGILHTFLELHQEDEELIRSYLHKKEYDKVLQLLHMLKGIAGNMCCYPLSSVCENGLNEMDREEYQHYPVFQEVWKNTIQSLKATYLKLRESLARSGPVGEEEALWKHIRALCLEHDIEAISLLEENAHSLSLICGEELMEKILDYCIRFEFGKIGNIMKQFLPEGNGEVRCTG